MNPSTQSTHLSLINLYGLNIIDPLNAVERDSDSIETEKQYPNLSLALFVPAYSQSLASRRFIQLNHLKESPESYYLEREYRRFSK